MSDDFYIKLEQKYRGSYNEVKKRLFNYHPLIKIMNDQYPSLTCVDIGCGRGEWLDLIKEISINIKGIDQIDYLDSKLNKKVLFEKINFKDFFKKTADETFNVISAFHFIEHISFEEQLFFLKESFRTLKPGGLLLLETPNIENINVVTNSFHLDPSHTKPINKYLLNHMLEYTGFNWCSSFGVNVAPINKNKININDIFYSAAQDRAFLALKNPSEKLKRKFNNFIKNYEDIDKNYLIHNYESNLNRRFMHQINQLDKNLQLLLDKNVQLLHKRLNEQAIRSDYFLRLLRPQIFLSRLILKIKKKFGKKI